MYMRISTNSCICSVFQKFTELRPKPTPVTIKFYVYLTDKTVGIKEAIRQGILDADLSSFTDLHTGKVYTIQEAIDEGLLVATLDPTNKPTTTGTGVC